MFKKLKKVRKSIAFIAKKPKKAKKASSVNVFEEELLIETLGAMDVANEQDHHPPPPPPDSETDSIPGPPDHPHPDDHARSSMEDEYLTSDSEHGTHHHASHTQMPAVSAA